MKKLVLLMIAALFSTSSLAGISVSVNIPETLTPTDGSVVNNPVTLISTEFDTTQSDGSSGTLTLGEYQWFIGEWDHIKKSPYNSEIIDLPFAFNFYGQDYGKIGITTFGYVSLLPSDYAFNNFNDFQHIARNFENSLSGTFQLATYPTIFPVAKNNQYHNNWRLSLTTNFDIVENKSDVVLVKNTPDKVIIYTHNQIIRVDETHATTYYPLEQVIVLHSNGNVELHYATDFPFADMMVDTEAYETSTPSSLGVRYYSGLMIPRSITGTTPTPLINNIETNGNKSYLFTASTLNNLSAESLPDDGSNLEAAAPVLMDGIDLETEDLPYTQFSSTDTASITVTAQLDSGESYIWATRQLAANPGIDPSAWTESSQFTIEKEDDNNDDGFLGLGSTNPFLILCASLLLFIRKQK